jgi:hypothetical protein
VPSWTEYTTGERWNVKICSLKKTGWCLETITCCPKVQTDPSHD